MSNGNDCSEGTYNTTKGLEFSLYCDLDQPYEGDLGDFGSDSVEDCLEQCALNPQSLCAAAIFVVGDSRCFLKNESVTAKDATERKGYILGVAKEEQLEPLRSNCQARPEPEKTDNGLEFNIYCNQQIGDYGICRDDNPECRIHAESLQECMEYCSTMNPLCTGVVWHSNLENGYLNCYPKNATARELDKIREDKDGFHAAKALLDFDVIEDDCLGRSDSTIEVGNDGKFDLECGKDHPDNTLDELHLESLDACVEECNSRKDGECLAAVFDAGMKNGYQNCYLKSKGNGSTPPKDGFTLAVRQGADKPDPIDIPETKDNDKKAWIAGPVVGGVVGVAVILAAIWWFRKRKRASKAPTAPVHPNAQDDPQKGKFEPTMSHPPTYELDSQVYVPELEGNGHGGYYQRG